MFFDQRIRVPPIVRSASTVCVLPEMGSASGEGTLIKQRKLRWALGDARFDELRASTFHFQAVTTAKLTPNRNAPRVVNAQLASPYAGTGVGVVPRLNKADLRRATGRRMTGAWGSMRHQNSPSDIKTGDGDRHSREAEIDRIHMFVSASLENEN
uniref:Uncharacterized protein n=1 Tax=Parascaris univalens TaxID=6257 RepID=A0A915AUA3_PARUN